MKASNELTDTNRKALIGIAVLAERASRQQKELVEAAAELLGAERDKYGFHDGGRVEDLIYSTTPVDDMEELFHFIDRGED